MNYSRRSFIKLSSIVGGSALFGFNLSALAASDSTKMQNMYELDALIKIAGDNKISLILNRIEMGQGVITSLPMILAEELDACWQDIEVELAPVDKDKYSMQTTTASISVYLAWSYCRKAAAEVKYALMQVAAKRWGVNSELCHTSESYVYGPMGQSLSYGELAEDAIAVKAPSELILKEPEQFKLVGQSIQRKDFNDLITGSARYGTDSELPDMLYAAILKAPTAGAKPLSWESEIEASNVRILPIPSGIAAVSSNYWEAQNIVDSINVKWKYPEQSLINSQDEMVTYQEALKTKGFVVSESKNFESKHLACNQHYTFNFELPLMAHATLEPPNALVHLLPNKCLIWLPTQAPDKVQNDISKLLNLEYRQVEVVSTLVGGGFGRKSYRDFAIDAVNTAKHFNQPVKLVYSREADIKGDLYRPATAYEVNVGATPDSILSTYRVRGSGPSILQYYEHPQKKAESVDFDYLTFAGIDQNPYGLSNFKAEAHTLIQSHRKPVGILRSIGHSSSCFVREVVIDEIAKSNQLDPVRFRLNMLSENPRAAEVLRLAAKHSGWYEARPEGRFYGCALFVESHPEEQFFAYNAQVAEVSINSKEVVVHRVTTVGDFGRIINPDSAKNQMEGGVIFGMSLALFDEITMSNGHVEQSNFHDFRLPRMSDAPIIESYLVDSEFAPSGLGEKVVPATVPAICNAVSQATGKIVSRLPIRLSI